jgi:MFS family permease
MVPVGAMVPGGGHAFLFTRNHFSQGRTRLLKYFLRQPMVNSLINLKGNSRAVVYTEALWGIPFNLYAPYMSVYMLSFGLRDSQIGLLTSIGLVLSILTSLMSGVITDKLGRKRTTLISDVLSWSVPAIIWAVAQDFNYFLIAVALNSLWRVSMNSWSCLVVEDTDPKQLMDIYSWIYIAGQVVAFFAPIAGLLMRKFTLVPTMRGLFLFASVMFTFKFFVMNAFVSETKRGKARMEATRQQGLFSMLGEYSGVSGMILKSPAMLYTVGIMLVMGICNMITSTFWSILVTRKLLIPEQDLALFPFVRSSIMLLFFFLVMPRIREMNFKKPMLVGFGIFIISQVLLISIPAKNYVLLVINVFLDACSYAMVGTQIDRMVAVTVDAKERARIMALVYVVVIIFISPFGWIAGKLSEVDRILPFILSLGLYAAGAVLTYLAARLAQPVRTNEVVTTNTN